MPDEAGEVPEIYLYQRDTFIALCRPVPLYNEAQAEQTDEDVRSYAEQAAYVAQFDAMMRRDKIRPVEIMPRGVPDESAEVVTPADPVKRQNENMEIFRFDTDYAAQARHDL